MKSLFIGIELINADAQRLQWTAIKVQNI